MNFAETAKNFANMKRTENGAPAYKTTTNAVLDLFAQIGALRPRTEEEILAKIDAAYQVDSVLTTKMIFYAGNVRGGLGERRTFRIGLKYLANHNPRVLAYNIALIPHFNRWDSVFSLVGTPCETAMWEIISEQLMLDMEGVNNSKTSAKPIGISLLAKWMPTETAHSKETRALAHRAFTRLGLSPRVYRKMLSALRAHLNIVESLMSAGKWNEVEYPKVPSYAMKNYRNAFAKHDPDGFSQYIQSLQTGEVKINASTLFPYDLVNEYLYGKGRYSNGTDPILEAQWKALPNYVEGENNILVMADVSGSMIGRPMATSIGLATYFAQRNHGDYHNLYMSFTDYPHFINLDGHTTLRDCVRYVEREGIGYSTNLNRAFATILQHAIDNGVTPTEMPKALVVISDMEIDNYTSGRANMDFVQKWKAEFTRRGYTLPKLVMWNVEARNDTFLSQSPDVLMISGQSASNFKNLCADLNGKTAWDMMLEVLNDPMYDCITM